MYIHVGVLHNNAMYSSVLQSAYYVFVRVYCMYDVLYIHKIRVP